MNNTIGKRIQYFRNKSGLSQFQLEMEIDASPGSLSRIEHGLTNPSKETIAKISKVLNLSHREINYLEGYFDSPLTGDDIEKAIKLIAEHFSKREVLAYMFDEHFRLVYASKSMQLFMGVSDKQLESLLGISLIEILSDEKYGIKQLFDPSSYSESMQNLLEQYNSTAGYMVDTEGCKYTMEVIEQYPLIKELWDVAKETTVHYNLGQKRRVMFNLNGLKIPVLYSSMFIWQNERFEVTEFYIEPSLLDKIITKLYS